MDRYLSPNTTCSAVSTHPLGMAPLFWDYFADLAVKELG
jgi:hypothetical protein